MTTGERIKDLRIKRHLTADQLAELVGVNRATIYRYEKGDIENMCVDVLQPLAAALKTTPMALMGWDEPLALAAEDLTPEEAALLADFRSMNEEGRYIASAAVHGLAINPIYKNVGSDQPDVGVQGV